MRGDHDELEIFLEIRLIPFTNRSKVEEQRREIHAFKEENWPDFVGHWSGRGGGFAESWERFLGATSRLPDRHGISSDLASN